MTPEQRTTTAADEGPDAEPFHYVAHLLWEVGARASVIAEAEMAGTSLSMPSSGILQMVAAEPGITAAELARRQPKSQQAISQVTARLEKLGYIERRVGSGRGVGLHVTEAGLDARDLGVAAEARVEERLRELFGAEAYERLRALLDEARDALTR